MKKGVAMTLVSDEIARARSNHAKFNSAHEGYAVIKEEVDELWDEIKANRGSSHRAVSEAVQVAAMAVRYLIDLCDEEAATGHKKQVYRHERGYVIDDYKPTGYSG